MDVLTLQAGRVTRHNPAFGPKPKKKKMRGTPNPTSNLGQRLVAPKGRCEFCGTKKDLTLHHVTPVQLGGKLGHRTMLCPTCHKWLHKCFTNQSLRDMGLSYKDNKYIKDYIKSHE